jgi:hypothetical protein
MSISEVDKIGYVMPGYRNSEWTANGILFSGNIT